MSYDKKRAGTHTSNRPSLHHNPFGKDIFIITQYYAKGNSNLNNTNLQTLQSAKDNGIISDAMRVDLNDAYGVLNRPCMITSGCTMQNIHADCAWGIREVLYLNENMIAIRITGVKTSGTESKIWTNCYNYGTWTGWV